MSEVNEIATALCDHFVEGRSADTPLREIRRCSDAAFVAHYLNGPGADTVMASKNYRWLSVDADDVAGLGSVSDLLELCRKHVVARDVRY